MSTLTVVEQILRETETPMSVRQIVDHADGRLPTRSRTPDTVVARDLSMDIKKRGGTSVFIRTEPGRIHHSRIASAPTGGRLKAKPEKIARMAANTQVWRIWSPSQTAFRPRW